MYFYSSHYLQMPQKFMNLHDLYTRGKILVKLISALYLRCACGFQNLVWTPVQCGHNLPPLVEVGLTDLPKSGGAAIAPPAPPGMIPLITSSRKISNKARVDCLTSKKIGSVVNLPNWLLGNGSMLLQKKKSVDCKGTSHHLFSRRQKHY